MVEANSLTQLGLGPGDTAGEWILIHRLADGDYRWRRQGAKGTTLDPKDADFTYPDEATRDAAIATDLPNTNDIAYSTAEGSLARFTSGGVWQNVSSAPIPEDWIEVPSGSATLTVNDQHHLADGLSVAAPIPAVGKWFAVRSRGPIGSTVTGVTDGALTGDGSAAYYVEQAGAWVRLPSGTVFSGDPFAAVADIAARDALTGMAEGDVAQLADGSAFIWDGAVWQALASTTHPVPTPVAPADNQKILRVDATGAYVLVSETVTDPNWQPATAYVTGETVTATDPSDGFLHRYIAISDHTSGAAFDAAEETANWQDLGVPTGLIGASVGADGATGEVPQPLAGQQNHVLQGDATWVRHSNYRGQVLATPAIYTWDADNPTEAPLIVGDVLWSAAGGIKKKGAFKRLLALPATSGATWSGWYGDITFVGLWDSTQDDFSNTQATWDITS